MQIYLIWALKGLPSPTPSSTTENCVYVYAHRGTCIVTCHMGSIHPPCSSRCAKTFFLSMTRYPSNTPTTSRTTEGSEYDIVHGCCMDAACMYLYFFFFFFYRIPAKCRRYMSSQGLMQACTYTRTI